MREVDRRDLQVLLPEVAPYVELGPVGQREHPDVLGIPDPGVVDVPQLRALVLRIPLPELVTEREHPFLGACFLLVAARSAENRTEPVLLYRFEVRGRLHPVPALPPSSLLGHPPRV